MLTTKKRLFTWIFSPAQFSISINKLKIGAMCESFGSSQFINTYLPIGWMEPVKWYDFFLQRIREIDGFIWPSYGTIFKIIDAEQTEGKMIYDFLSLIQAKSILQNQRRNLKCFTFKAIFVSFSTLNFFQSNCNY